jgi:hypothetical protein
MDEQAFAAVALKEAGGTSYGDRSLTYRLLLRIHGITS